jgi:rare lipoprotein A (peptidoglycan hydrolase)
MSDIGTSLQSGQATWYCSPTSACTHGYGPSDMVGAIDPTLGIDKGSIVTVTHGDTTIAVRIVDVCACPGDRLIDLTSGAFSRLAPLSAGVIDIELEAGLALPPTDTWTHQEPPTQVESLSVITLALVGFSAFSLLLRRMRKR